MRTIPLRDGKINTIDVLSQVMKLPGANGVTVGDMRKRIRIIDVIDAAGGSSMNLEDADWEFLNGAVNSFVFGVADRELLTIIDDVANAQVVKPPQPDAESAA